MADTRRYDLHGDAFKRDPIRDLRRDAPRGAAAAAAGARRHDADPVRDPLRGRRGMLRDARFVRDARPPRDDLLSGLVKAALGGDRLSEDELFATVVL
jgi:cytochrome P450